MKILPLPAAISLAAIALVSSLQADGKDYHDQDLKNHNFTNGSLNGADFSDAILDHADFSGASLKKANFKSAQFPYAKFISCDLTGADLRETKGPGFFSNSDLSKTNMEGLAFAIGYGCKYHGANLKGAKITGGAVSNDFGGADLRGANLRGVVSGPNVRWRGAVYDEDTAWPDGFDLQAAGVVLAAPEEKKEPAPKTEGKKPAE